MKHRRAFTLIELLVVISIISILISILLPALGAAREQALAISCSSRIKQLSMLSFVYIEDFKGYLPPMSDPNDVVSGMRAPWTRPMCSYVVKNPGFEIRHYSNFYLNGTADALANDVGHASMYSCPAAVRKVPLMQTTTYGRNAYLTEEDISNWNTTAPKLTNATKPSSTLFYGDVELNHGANSALPWFSNYEMPTMTLQHKGADINLSWVDGHVTRQPALKYAESQYLPGADEDVYYMIK